MNGLNKKLSLPLEIKLEFATQLRLVYSLVKKNKLPVDHSKLFQSSQFLFLVAGRLDIDG